MEGRKLPARAVSSVAKVHDPSTIHGGMCDGQNTSRTSKVHNARWETRDEKSDKRLNAND